MNAIDDPKNVNFREVIKIRIDWDNLKIYLTDKDKRMFSIRLNSKSIKLIRQKTRDKVRWDRVQLSSREEIFTRK